MGDRLDLDFLHRREDAAATRGFFGGVVLGMLLGVVLTLVFAPRRGEETRAAVVDMAGDLRHLATDVVHRVPGLGDEQTGGEDEHTQREVAIEREITVDGPVAG